MQMSPAGTFELHQHAPMLPAQSSGMQSKVRFEAASLDLRQLRVNVRCEAGVSCSGGGEPGLKNEASMGQLGQAGVN